MGRATQGVKVMNIKDDDRVSAVALVVESEDAVEPPSAEDAGQEALAEPSPNGDAADTAEPGDAAEPEAAE
jgi:DNA gyrase subunit A